MSLFASLGSAEEVDHSLWGDGGLFGSNPVQEILDKGDGNFTLDELLQEDELIQEIKHLNQSLIDFLSKRDTVRKLVAYATRDDTSDEAEILKVAKEEEEEGPSNDGEENAQQGRVQGEDTAEAADSNGEGATESAGQSGPSQLVIRIINEKEKLARFAYTASEIFSCEVQGVNHHLLEAEDVPLPGANIPSRPQTIEEDAALADGSLQGEQNSAVPASGEEKEGPLIGAFFSVLNRDAISPRTAGYLEKIVDVFLQREADRRRMTSYVNAHPELLPRFIFHLSIISVSNVLRKLLDATDLTPLPDDGEIGAGEGGDAFGGHLVSSDGEDNDMPAPMSDVDLMSMTVGKRGGRHGAHGNAGSFGYSQSEFRERIMWAGKLRPSGAANSNESREEKIGESDIGKVKAEEDHMASVVIVESLVSVFIDSTCEDDKYVSASDALIDAVNRSTAQETILSLQSDEPPSNSATGLMDALNTPTVVKMLIHAATDGKTNKSAVQACLSVLVRLIEWHAQNLQAEADAALPIQETLGSDNINFAEAETPKAVVSKKPSEVFGENAETEGNTLGKIAQLPLLVAEVLRQMPRLVDDLLSDRPGATERRFSNGGARVPFGLVRLQAVELLTHMVYVRHPEVSVCANVSPHTDATLCVCMYIPYKI